MKNDVICNLVSGKMGRSSFFSRRPIAYYGESSIWQFFFEDTADAYAGGIGNVDKDGVGITVKIGARGQAPILTVVDDDFDLLDPNITLSSEFDQLSPSHTSMGQLRWKFSQTPLNGYFRIGLTAAVSFPSQPNWSDTITPAIYSLHAPETPAISVNSSEADIEDYISSMITEFCGGEYHEATNILRAPGGTAEVEGGIIIAEDNTWRTAMHEIAKSVKVSNIDANEWIASVDVRPWPISVYLRPSLSGVVGQAAPARLHISAMTIADADVVDPTMRGAFGRIATIPFTAAGFGAALGGRIEQKLWMEVMLDSGTDRTVCDGEILLKKRMA